MSAVPLTSNQSLTVVSSFRRYNEILTYFNLDNFYGHDRDTIVHNVIRFIGAVILYTGLFLVFAFNLYYAYVDTDLELAQRIFQMSAVIIMLQHILMALSLTLKNRQIYKTFDRIQKMMEGRKTPLCFFFVGLFRVHFDSFMIEKHHS